MAKTLRSRIWTSVLDLEAEHITFPDKVYKGWYCSRHKTTTDELKKKKVELNLSKIKHDFDEDILGSHFEDHQGEQTLMVDPKKYLSFVSKMLHGYSDRILVYGIVHDQDTQYDEHGDPVYKEGKKVLALTPKHFHLLIRFDKAVLISTVSQRTGIIQSELEKGKTRGRYAFSSAMAYLVHALDPKKHQYKPEDVINGDFNHEIANENGLYSDFYIAHRDEWSNRQATVEKQRRQVDYDKVYQDTIAGKYSHRDFVHTSPELRLLYGEHKQQLDQARQIYLENRFYDYTDAVDRGDIQIQTLFIFGKSGNGKSALAQAVLDGVKHLSDGKWDVFHGGSQHTFDDYDGQELISLDDMRVEAMNAGDWLHLLDPHNTGTMAARYHDAQPMPRLLVITTTEPVHQFFAYARGANSGQGYNEPLDQFLRRIQFSANVVDLDHVDLGRNTRLSVPHRLELPDEVRTWSTNEAVEGEHEMPSKQKHINYKRTPKKQFNYAFEEFDNDTFENIAERLILHYGRIFGLIHPSNTQEPALKKRETTGSALPIMTGGGKISVYSKEEREALDNKAFLDDTFGPDPENNTIPGLPKQAKQKAQDEEQQKEARIKSAKKSILDRVAKVSRADDPENK